jgi:hypothetical protein
MPEDARRRMTGQSTSPRAGVTLAVNGQDA